MYIILLPFGQHSGQTVNRDHGTFKVPETSICLKKTNIRIIGSEKWFHRQVVAIAKTYMNLIIIILYDQETSNLIFFFLCAPDGKRHVYSQSCTSTQNLKLVRYKFAAPITLIHTIDKSSASNFTRALTLQNRNPIMQKLRSTATKIIRAIS